MRNKPKPYDYLRKAPTCKYCLKQIPGISRFLLHLRHHEVNIRPYWYKNSKLKPKSGTKRIWPKWSKYRTGIIGEVKSKKKKDGNKASWLTGNEVQECAGNKASEPLLCDKNPTWNNTERNLQEGYMYASNNGRTLLKYKLNATCNNTTERKLTYNEKYATNNGPTATSNNTTEKKLTNNEYATNKGQTLSPEKNATFRNTERKLGTEEYATNNDKALNYGKNAIFSRTERKLTSNKKIRDILAKPNYNMHDCDYCGASFKDGMSKRLHELVQHREQLFPLSFIKSIQEQRKLVEIKPPAEEIEEKAHKCDFCDERFHTREKKKLHEMTHKGKKPHKCDYCDQTFTFKNRKLRHEIYHTGVKPHKCSYCEKEFIYASDKRHHEAKHRGHKTYKCRFCDQEFDYNTEKVKHEKEHTGGKRYMCQNCGRKFRYPSDVKEHWKNSRRCRPPDEESYLKSMKQPRNLPKENGQAVESKLDEGNEHVLPGYKLSRQPGILPKENGQSVKPKSDKANKHVQSGYLKLMRPPGSLPTENGQAVEPKFDNRNEHIPSLPSTPTAKGPTVFSNQASTSFTNYPQPLIVIPNTGTSTVKLQPCTTQPWVVPLRASELLAHIKSMENGKLNSEQTKQVVPTDHYVEKVMAVPKNNNVAQEKFAPNVYI